jgi:hypothetical protein
MSSWRDASMSSMKSAVQPKGKPYNPSLLGTKVEETTKSVVDIYQIDFPNSTNADGMLCRI